MVVHKVTTGPMKVNLCWQEVDNLPEALSGTVGGHTVSVFR